MDEEPEVREKVLAFLDSQPRTRVGFASGWLAQEIDELDLAYADSGDEDIHVFNVLEQLVEEGLCQRELVGDCNVCGAEAGFAEPGVYHCLNPHCEGTVATDHPLYSFSGVEAQLVISPGPRRRPSALAERLLA